MRFDQPRGLRQSMTWLHTWSGLLLGWLMFAIFVTGTLSFFRNEITFWMQPELHRANRDSVAIDRALQVLQQEAPADATQWTITLPNPRSPTLGLSWQAASGAQAQGAGRETPSHAAGAGENRAHEGAAAREGNPRGAESRGSRGEGRSREGAAARGGNPSRAGRDGENRAREGVRPRRPDAAESAPWDEDGEAGGDEFQESQNSPPREAQPVQARQQAHGGGGGGGNRGPRVMLDPATGEKLAARETAGGNFLYRFHFELYGLDRIWARWIVGIATMFMFVALISGVIVHRHIFKDFFTFRPAKGKRSWIDAHNASAVLSLPFHIVITFSSLLLLGNLLIPTAAQRLYPGNASAYMQESRGRGMSAPTPPSGERAPLTDLAPLLAKAAAAWPERPVGSIAITNPGDRQSVVELRQNMAGGSIADGRGSLAQSLRFDGVSGQPLEVAAAPPPPSAVQTISNVFIMLHRGLFASPVPRWLLFLAGIGGCLMIASGLVMWSIARDKAREKLGHIPFGQQLVEVFNVSGIAGLLVAIGAYFWANRLIPADLPQRNAWEIRVFFIVWAATLAHALLRKNKTAWVEELVGAGLLIAALPLLNALTGGLSLIGSIARGQGLLAGFDLCALAIGMGLFYAARQVYRHTPATRTANTAAARSADTAGETAAPDGETSPAPQPLSGFAKPQAEESR